MKIKPGFEVQEVCGQSILMAMGEENIDFSKVIALNETSLFIWNQMTAGVCDVEKIAEALIEEYDTDLETAKADIKALQEKFVELGVAEK